MLQAHPLLQAGLRAELLRTGWVDNKGCAIDDTWSGLRIEAFTLVSVVTSHLDLVAIANTHLPILDALRSGDAHLTGKVMREHITSFGDMLTGEHA